MVAVGFSVLERALVHQTAARVPAAPHAVAFVVFVAALHREPLGGVVVPFAIGAVLLAARFAPQLFAVGRRLALLVGAVGARVRIFLGRRLERRVVDHHR